MPDLSVYTVKRQPGIPVYRRIMYTIIDGTILLNHALETLMHVDQLLSLDL